MRNNSLYFEVEVFCAKWGYLGSGDRGQLSVISGQFLATCGGGGKDGSGLPGKHFRESRLTGTDQIRTFRVNLTSYLRCDPLNKLDAQPSQTRTDGDLQQLVVAGFFS
jgi:hypothetical protein